MCCLTEVIHVRKCHMHDSGVTDLVVACLTLIGHLLCQCCVNQTRFIQLQGMHIAQSYLYVTISPDRV